MCSHPIGCLRLLPSDAPQPPSAAADAPASEATLRWLEEEGEALAVDVCAEAGDAVLFSSRLWHCSGPNRTGADRRVYYGQYSRGAIGGDAPLCLAVRTRDISIAI